MLTRLEVDGFKNLIGFDASFGAFTCIAGENGVGKSNIFDAIQFLSLMADMSLLEASQEVRSSREDSEGQPEHLFTLGQTQRRMRLAVEMVVPDRVEDDFGTDVTPSITLLRYEVRIGYEPSSSRARQGRLVLEAEDLRHINRRDAHKHLRFPHSVSQFRNVVVIGERRGGPFISTELDSGRITVHQDGGSRGRPRRALPPRPATTVVSTINSADDPTVLAVRRELQSWRRLALEPSALRAADSYNDPSMMLSDGRHLAAALDRIATGEPDSSPEDVYSRIANRLSSLAGLDIRQLRVDSNDIRQLLTIMTTDGEGRELPARSLSEGTLRYLALCVLLEDPLMTGLITMEEPENGIHPANLPQVVQLVRDLAVDPRLPPGPGNPLRQVIVNTHSPAVVQLVGNEDLLVARERAIDSDGVRIRALSVEGFKDTWRTEDKRHGATRADLLPYLAHPPGAQIALFDDVA
jgi:predicted ATPase